MGDGMGAKAHRASSMAKVISSAGSRIRTTPPVAHDAGSGNARQAGKVGCQGFDHHLLAAHEGIHHQAHPSSAGGYDHHGKFRVGVDAFLGFI